MPCRYDDYGPGVPVPTPGETKLRRELDKVTKAACDLANGIENLAEDYISSDSYIANTLLHLVKETYITRETHDWIVSHREADKKRKDEIRASALSKLTAEEKEALGL